MPITRKTANPIDVAIGLIIIGLAVMLFEDSPHVYQLEQPSLDVSLRYLPFYTMASLARMIVALVLSLIIGIITGYLAAVNRRWAQVILPAADIFQSVPVLGFFPAAVFLFIRLFGNGAIGVELAEIFLIITSALWNLIFAVYESVTTIPEELQLASLQFGLRGYIQWTRVVLPAVLHKLAYNSMISWANGWYFLIASEIITIGPIRYQLPGLGSYLAQTMQTGNYQHAVYGLLVLTAVLLLFHLFVWSPLNDWSTRFMYDSSEHPVVEIHRRSRLRFYMARSRFLQALWNRAIRPTIAGIVLIIRMVLERERTRRGNIVAWALFILFLGLIVRGVVGSFTHLLRPDPLMNDIPSALILSFLRLVAAYLIGLAWCLPLAMWIGRNERVARRVLPVIEVIASIPATAFFPLIVVFIIRSGGDMNLASILLVTTGMQWYLLFNLIAGVRAIPEELVQISASLRLQGITRWRRLVLPAIYPSLVTGSLTAIGGGWNALVLSEYVPAEGHVYSVHGIGALLDYATYESGSLPLIVMSITAMVLFIIIVNRLVWQPAYHLAQRRFALNY
jgi:NitT/TauT family transport system permease protein